MSFSLWIGLNWFVGGCCDLKDVRETTGTCLEPGSFFCIQYTVVTRRKVVGFHCRWHETIILPLLESIFVGLTCVFSNQIFRMPRFGN